jgi:hypothetical protein
MLGFLWRRLVYTLPIMLGVALVCFALVHLAPGDPLVSILPPDASAELQAKMKELYGFNRSYPEQFVSWVWRAVQGDLGTSIASNRPVFSEVMKAVGNTLRLAMLATLIGFVLGCLFGFVAGYFQNSWLDKLASLTSVLGVSVPHYWLGMVLVIVFSSILMWLPPGGAGPGGSGDWAWDWEHFKHMLLPAITMSVIPMGIISRTVRLGGRHLGPGVHSGFARQRFDRCGRLHARGEKCRAHCFGGDGFAIGLFVGWLDLDRDRFFVAGHRFFVECRHFSARPAFVAGNHFGFGHVLCGLEPDRGCGANPARSAHFAQLKPRPDS